MKNWNWFKILIVLFVGICAVYIYAGNAGVVRQSIEQHDSDTTTGELVTHNEIGQSFYYDQNNLCGVSFKIGTYMRVNKGELILGIRELNEKNDIYQTTLKADSLVDNQFLRFRFPPIKFSKGKTYYAYIKSKNGVEGESITVYASSANTFEKGELYINGVKQQGDMTMEVYYNRSVFNVVEDKIKSVFK